MVAKWPVLARGDPDEQGASRSAKWSYLNFNLKKDSNHIRSYCHYTFRHNILISFYLSIILWCIHFFVFLDPFTLCFSVLAKQRQSADTCTLCTHISTQRNDKARTHLLKFKALHVASWHFSLIVYILNLWSYLCLITFLSVKFPFFELSWSQAAQRHKATGINLFLTTPPMWRKISREDCCRKKIPGYFFSVEERGRKRQLHLKLKTVWNKTLSVRYRLIISYTVWRC